MFSSLSLDYLKRAVPSVFTQDSADRTSSKYQHISTEKVVQSLMREGFLPTWAAQCRTRVVTKRIYTKHMLRFRHCNSRPNQQGLYPEIVLVNSHDGLSSYRLMSGIYRIVCSNGLVAGQSYDEIRVRHQGDIIGNVIEGTYTVIKNAQKMLDVSAQMSTITLNESEKLLLAEAAHAVRFEEEKLGEAFKPSSFLRPRRLEDFQSHDLFTIFNVIQENTIKGGVSGYSRAGNGRLKQVTTRPIRSIDQGNALNKALWTLAEKMLELKQ